MDWDTVGLTMNPDQYHIIVIGGGGTGAALIHDLALRGFRATLLEKGEILSGTTGRHHGLLHSGARYAVTDQEAAKECIQENNILREITTDVLELNDGLFVTLCEEDEEFLKDFLEGCGDCGIPSRVLTAEEAIRLEPNLNAHLISAVQVPDGTMDAFRLPLQFLATARHNGADARTFSEVVDFEKTSSAVRGVRVLDRRKRTEYTLTGDLVVNAAGAWAGYLSCLADTGLTVLPSPGVMVAVEGRITNMAVSRLHPPGDGDVLVPQRNLTVLGTSSWTVEDPDGITARREDVERMIEKTARLAPGLKETRVLSAWAAARPLISAGAEEGRALSRTFKCFDHAVDDGVEGLISIAGGKATLLRAMAESTVDLVCRKLGESIPCRTRETKLLPFRSYYANTTN